MNKVASSKLTATDLSTIKVCLEDEIKRSDKRRVKILKSILEKINTAIERTTKFKTA